MINFVLLLTTFEMRNNYRGNSWHLHFFDFSLKTTHPSQVMLVQILDYVDLQCVGLILIHLSAKFDYNHFCKTKLKRSLG